MVRLNKRMLVLANDSLDLFINFILLHMEDDIKATVKLSISKEVVVGRMVKFNLFQVVFLKKMFEDRDSGGVLGVHIGIAPNEDIGVIHSRDNVF